MNHDMFIWSDNEIIILDPKISYRNMKYRGNGVLLNVHLYAWIYQSIKQDFTNLQKEKKNFKLKKDENMAKKSGAECPNWPSRTESLLGL